MNKVCKVPFPWAPYGGLTSPAMCSSELVCHFIPVKCLPCQHGHVEGPNSRGGPVWGLLALFMHEDKVAQRG